MTGSLRERRVVVKARSMPSTSQIAAGHVKAPTPCYNLAP
jgi:hypothetical protein